MIYKFKYKVDSIFKSFQKAKKIIQKEPNAFWLFLFPSSTSANAQRWGGPVWESRRPTWADVNLDSSGEETTRSGWATINPTLFFVITGARMKALSVAATCGGKESS